MATLTPERQFSRSAALRALAAYYNEHGSLPSARDLAKHGLPGLAMIRKVLNIQHYAEALPRMRKKFGPPVPRLPANRRYCAACGSAR